MLELTGEKRRKRRKNFEVKIKEIHRSFSNKTIKASQDA